MPIQRPSATWKCKSLVHWQCQLWVNYFVREALQRSLLSFWVNGNYENVSWSGIFVGSAPVGPRITPLPRNQSERGRCCQQGWGLREHIIVRENRRFSWRSRPSNGNSLMPLTVPVGKRWTHEKSSHEASLDLDSCFDHHLGLISRP